MMIDGDSQFKAKICRQFCLEASISLDTTPSYDHHAIGNVDHFNGTLIQQL